jgi:hypothetical protein
VSAVLELEMDPMGPRGGRARRGRGAVVLHRFPTPA